MRSLLLMLCLAGCKRSEPSPALAPQLEPTLTRASAPSRHQTALELVRPRRVSVTAFDETSGLDGRAEDFDDVSEFMRALNNLVWTPKGWARVVERQRNGGFRVEFLENDRSIVDISPDELEFMFAGARLESTQRSGDGGVTFRMTLGDE